MKSNSTEFTNFKRAYTKMAYKQKLKDEEWKKHRKEVRNRKRAKAKTEG